MKKIICFLILCLLYTLIQAGDDSAQTEADKADKLVAISLGAGLKNVFEDPFANVYHTFNFSLTVDIALKLGKQFELFFHSDPMFLKGSLTRSGEETTLDLFPIETGLRYFFGNKTIRPYLGMGGGLYLFKEKSPIGDVEKNVFGFLGHGGVRYHISGLLFVDLKLKYTFFRVKPDELAEEGDQNIAVNTRNLSGLALLASIGIQF